MSRFTEVEYVHHHNTGTLHFEQANKSSNFLLSFLGIDMESKIDEHTFPSWSICCSTSLANPFKSAQSTTSKSPPQSG